MKKKIVIKAQMNCDKQRTKAMKSIASAAGVASVAINGKDKDQLVVTGENVDCIEITRTLRKKLGYAEIVTVEEVKEEVKKEEKKPAKVEEKCTPPVPCCYYYPEPRHAVIYKQCYNADPCCIL